MYTFIIKTRPVYIGTDYNLLTHIYYIYYILHSRKNFLIDLILMDF